MAFLKKKTTPNARSRAGNLTAFLFLLVLGGFIALPLYYTAINAFKPINELFLFPPRFVVHNPTIENFREIVRVQSQSLVPVERYIFNSVFITAVATVGYTLIASMAGYTMAKLWFPARNIINTFIILAILFRPEVTALPQYMIMAKMGILDTYLALILPLMSTSFGVFLMTQFTQTIPNDMLEAARIDGAGEKFTYFRIVLPMVRPAWLTLMIFTFISSWNVSGGQFTYSETMKTLPVMMQQINTGGIARAGVTAAVSVLLMIPPIIIFVLCQNSVIETMASSGIKD